MKDTEKNASADKSPDSRSLIWNDKELVSALPIRRKIKIVGTKPVSPEQRKQFDNEGWPDKYVSQKEYKLSMVTADTTLVVISNYPDAEYELPHRIRTAARDLGTYPNSLVTWRRKKERILVSARLTSIKDRRAIESLATGQQEVVTYDQLHKMAVITRALQSGLLVPNAPLSQLLTDEENALANLLMTFKDQDKKAVLSLEVIGGLYGCSYETIRRRRNALFDKYPDLGRSIKVFRARNNKGCNPDTPGASNPGAKTGNGTDADPDAEN